MLEANKTKQKRRQRIKEKLNEVFYESVTRLKMDMAARGFAKAKIAIVVSVDGQLVRYTLGENTFFDIKGMEVEESCHSMKGE